MLDFYETADEIERVCKKMGAYSFDSKVTVLMIIAHESKCGTYWEQLGGGPALGAIQMEPRTHASTWDNADNIHENARKLGIERNVGLLLTSLEYNIFMARSFLLMDPNPIPAGFADKGKYLKAYYNTAGGKATWQNYCTAYITWAESYDL